MSDVLVCVTCRNYERWLSASVGSVVAQDIPVELQVLHDGCGTMRARGPAVLRNSVIYTTAAQYVLYLDADDIIPTDYVRRLRAVADGDTNVVVTCDGQSFGASYASTNVQRPITLESVMEFNTIHVSALISVELLRRHGGFDEALSAYEDWDLWCKLLARGAEFRHCAGVELKMRRHSGSRHANRKLHGDQMKAMLKERYGSSRIVQDVVCNSK